MSTDHNQHVREASIAWVSLRLQRERPHEDPPPELAGELVAIAEEHDIPIEDLIRWIDLESRKAPVTPGRARAWALAYHVTRQLQQREEQQS